MADKESMNYEKANEDDSLNLNMNKKCCILITKKELNACKVPDQVAHASPQPQIMEEDDENNDNCIVGYGFHFSVCGRLVHDEEVQHIIGRM